jgi:signal transduction histidine kinase
MSGRVWTRRTGLVLRSATVLAVVVVVGAAALVVAALVAGEAPGGGWSVVTVLAGALTAAGIWPALRDGSRRAVDRIVHGGDHDPEAVVRAVARRSTRDQTDDDLLAQVADSLLRGFRAATAEVWLHDGAGRLRLSVGVPMVPKPTIELDEQAQRVLGNGGVVGRSWLEMWVPRVLDGAPAGEVRIAPATHGATLLGVVVVTRLPGAERFSVEEDASLAELGGRLGVLLHNRELDAALRETLEDLRRANIELQASRGRLVSAADAERRRIERDLHDGAQQHLVALAVNLRLAADEVAAAPDTSKVVFEALGRDVREAIAELRSLAHGIYPPLLMDAGLVEALTVSARRSPSPVTVRAAGVARYGPEIEAAVYFCCMEALQNAAKHAPGADVVVELVGDATGIRFTVDDDGPGFVLGDEVGGRGLDNMADRIGAVGGRFRVAARPEGGTRVEGFVPALAAGATALAEGAGFVAEGAGSVAEGAGSVAEGAGS